MSSLAKLATPGVQSLSPYQPGKPIEELERELGIQDIVKLASNENPLGMSGLARQALIDACAEGARYPDGNGYALKLALHDYYSLTKQQDISIDQITLGNGSNDILDIIARCFADNTSEIIFSQYAFAVYALSCKSVGARPVMTPAKNWGHDLQAMLDALTEKTKVIFIANPNNPTGTSVDEGSLRTFLDAVPQNVIVVLDEAYIEYISDSEFPDGLNLLSLYPNLIVTRTFSKAWGLASLRVGYAVSQSEVADILNRVRQPFNVNTFALAAAASVLKDQDYLRRSIELNLKGLRQLAIGLDKLNLNYIPSKGNFITFDTGGDCAKVYDNLLQRGVIVRPVANYGMQGYLRVSVGLEQENQKFLDMLPESLTS